MELKNELLTQNYTKIYHEDKFRYNAPHNFIIGLADTPDDCISPICDIHFQEGPVKESGVNGVMGEDLIAIVLCRLEHFQKCEFACRENAMAITKLQEALMWLRKRTMAREMRGVEGTNKL